MERIVSDGSFAPAKKGARSRKNQAGKGTKWMVVVDGAVFLWETTFTLHPRRKSSSRKRHSRRSGSGVAMRADRGRNRCA